MSLTYNKVTGDYIIASDDDARAQAAGLTLAQNVRSQSGKKIWYTQVPYAALQYWEDADERARDRLGRIYTDYRASYAVHSDSTYPAPPGKEYLRFQLAGIDYGLKFEHVVIGDEPGLGKTIMAIGIANATGAKLVLVICPGRVRLHWQREVRGWSMIENVDTNPVVTSKKVDPFINYVFISYDLARKKKIHKALCAVEWDILVLDEIHYLKNHTAQRTRAVFGGGRGIFKNDHIAKHAKRIVGLTGTLLPNRPRECYTVARGLNWESIDWLSYDKFCYRFNPSGFYDSGAKWEKQGRLPELHARLRSNLMVRRLQEEVLPDLPDKRYELTYIESNGEIREILAKEAMLDFTIADLKNPSKKMFGHWSTLRREMGEAMAPRVLDHIEYLLDVVELPKVVVFAHHKKVMDFLAEGLSKYGVVQVRGGISLKASDDAIQKFKKEGKPRIFIGQMQASGEGIDGLQHAASHIVFVEPSPVPKDNEQCFRRCYRIGQHNNVLGQIMLVEGSLTEKILGMAINKTHVIHDVLDDEIKEVSVL